MIIDASEEVVRFLKTYASIVETEDGKAYYYMPYWLHGPVDLTRKRVQFDLLSWDKLPQDLKDRIQQFRQEPSKVGPTPLADPDA